MGEILSKCCRFQNTLPLERVDSIVFTPKEEIEVTTKPPLPVKMKKPGLSDFEILGELGRGGFGVVYYVIDKRKKKRLALKVIPKMSLEKKKEQIILKNGYKKITMEVQTFS